MGGTSKEFKNWFHGELESKSKAGQICYWKQEDFIGWYLCFESLIFSSFDPWNPVIGVQILSNCNPCWSYPSPWRSPKFHDQPSWERFSDNIVIIEGFSCGFLPKVLVFSVSCLLKSLFSHFPKLEQPHSFELSLIQAFQLVWCQLDFLSSI